MFGYGMAVLWGKPWLWDIRYCWYHYPHHAVEGDVWWYYMIELTFYWSLTFSQFYDVKRKGNVFINCVASAHYLILLLI